MSNVIPQQIFISEGRLHTEYSPDSKVTGEYMSSLLSNNLGDSFEVIERGKKSVVGHYVTVGNQHIYIKVANLTCMGGQEGDHPKDLKRIQYNFRWRNFYNEYSCRGKVLWLGLYSHRGINIWAFFEPESYISKHIGKTMCTQDGKPSNYSCHIFLNDLYQGYENGNIGRYYQKIDKNGNVVGAVSNTFLKAFFDNAIASRNPILEVINSINTTKVPWNQEILASQAIPYMRELIPICSFNQWKQNKWNGWLVEAMYSEYLHDSPSPYIHYVATTEDANVREEYRPFGLDLAYPHIDYHFIGDLKAVSEGDDNTYLNDIPRVDAALERYGRIWFVFYIHEKKKGDTNNYEMVEWRNNYIRSIGEWSRRKPFDLRDAPQTPYSITFKEMVIVELNSLTKDIYFGTMHQGVNSNGQPRNDKYSISKRFLRCIDDDRFVIDRFVVPQI